MAGEREYSRKLGLFLRPTASCISFTESCLSPMASTRRLILQLSGIILVWALVWVLVGVTPSRDYGRSSQDE